MIELGKGSIDVSGAFFTKDVGDTIRHNVENAVDVIAKEGLRMVQSNLAAAGHGGGFTSAGVEGGALHRHDLLSGAEVGSLYGRVRMKPGLSRGPGSAKYPSANVPYIVNRIMEAGFTGGHAVTTYDRSGRRNKWKHGAKTRKAIHHFRAAYRRMKTMAADIRADLVAGLD